MRILNYITAIVIANLMLTSCAMSTAKIYSVPNARALAKEQKRIAIIKPVVSIEGKSGVSAEAMIEQQTTESNNIQREIYSWMLERKMTNRMSQDVQDVNETNTKLSRAGYPNTLMTDEELCEVLGVDGLLTSNFALAKPMGGGAAVAATFLVGFGGATNKVTLSLAIKDCNEGKLIWNYSDATNGGLGSSPAEMVDRLMKASSDKMPYMTTKSPTRRPSSKGFGSYR
jgi:outer membrane PBP1 activator LpoA protein